MQGQPKSTDKDHEAALRPAGACLCFRACTGAARFFPLLILQLSLLIPASAQSRLDQLEATYQANLRTLHTPVLQDYLRELELLKSQFNARNRAGDVKQVEAEISRVKAIAGTTGVLPYTELEAAAALRAGSATPETPPVVPPARSAPATLPTLLAAEAFKSGDLNTRSGAIPLGSAEWRIFRLPAGTYDVLAIFSSDPLTKPEEVTLDIGGHQAKGVITPDRSTGSPETFRLIRLCQISLATEVSSTTLSLAAATKDRPLLWVKKIMLTLPKKQPSRIAD